MSQKKNSQLLLLIYMMSAVDAKAKKVPGNKFKTTIGVNQKNVPGHDFLTTLAFKQPKTEAPITTTLTVPDDNLQTTPVFNMKFVPTDNFLTTLGLQESKTIPNKNFVTTPGVEGPQTMFVPGDNFITTPGVEAPQTTVPGMATMFVPGDNFITSPGVEGPQTTVPGMATMFVPGDNFITTPGVEAPQTTVPGMATMFVPGDNFITSPGVEAPQTTVSNVATAFVPEGQFMTTHEITEPNTIIPNEATAFVPEGNFVSFAQTGEPDTTAVGTNSIENGGQNVIQTPAPSTDEVITGLTEQQSIALETIQTPFEIIPDFQTSPHMLFAATLPVVGIIPQFDEPLHAVTEPPQFITQKALAMVAGNDVHTTPAVELPELVTIPQDSEIEPVFQLAPQNGPTDESIALPDFQTITEQMQFEVGELIPISQETHLLTTPSVVNSATNSQVEAAISDIGFHTTTLSRETTPVMEYLSIPPGNELAFSEDAVSHPQSANGVLTHAGTTQVVARNDARTQIPNIPIVNFGTSPESLLDEPMADLSVSGVQLMNSDSAGQIGIPDNSSISENYPVTSTQQVPSSTLISGLQHHHLGSLLQTVLTDYYPQFRPRNDQNRFVAIFTDFVPINIIEFNTQEQKFSVMGYFKLDWRDDFLTWNPSSYEDTETLRISVKSIWTPKLTIDKAYDGVGIVGDSDTDIALINYRGYVRWFPEGIYSVVCKVTIQFYPFDKQTCVLTYFIADEDISTVNLKHVGDVDLTEYIENAEWKLTNLTVERKQMDNIYVINYHFNVERRGGFAMFTLVVPILMLSVLSGTTFLVPIESGEKCSFSVTVFLAYGIFETIVIDTLPHNSLDVSYFIIYLTSLLVVSVILTFYTIVQAKIFDSIGTRKFGSICKSSSSADMQIFTWGGLLKQLDNYVFVAFLLLVVGLTSTFFSVMEEKFDFL